MQKLDWERTRSVLDAVAVRHLLGGLSDRRGKIARMLAAGELISLRRGLYATRRDIDPRCLASTIYGPSYVSYETALEWHGLIPEAVREIVSATPRRGRVFENELGRFRYFRIPKAVYPVGIQRVTESDLPFLIASPTKAICDRIAREPGFRSMADVARWFDGMRIGPDVELDAKELAHCAARYGRPSVRCLLRYAKKKGIVS